MSDIVMVYPATGPLLKHLIELPLSVLSASSLVSQHYSVKIIDQRTDDRWQETLMRELASKPLCLGISTMTGSQIKYALDAAAIVKYGGWPETKVVFGGVHPTLLPEQTVSHPLVDIVVAGEGEQTFLDLVDALASGKDLHQVKGLALKDGLTAQREFVDLNALPPLPYHLLDIEPYIDSHGKFDGKGNRNLSFISSRGCPWRCSYCANPTLFGRRFRSMTAQKTYEHISDLVSRFHLDSLILHDDEFLVNHKRAEDIADLIGGQFLWRIQCRMDTIMHSNLSKLESGGLREIQPGIESGSNRILKLVNKGETKECFIEANQMLAETSIKPLYNFMYGYPFEAEEDIYESLDLALRLLRDNHRAELAAFYVFIPYPGSEIFNEAVKQGFNPPATLNQWAPLNYQYMSTPWIMNNQAMAEEIGISSKFIDGKRLAKRLGLTPFDSDLITDIFRKRWANHDFSKSYCVDALIRAMNETFGW